VPSPVAVLTAAAHRGGARVTRWLVDGGWDLVFWESFAMRARVLEVEARGQRAVSAAGEIGDAAWVDRLATTTAAAFPTVDAVVHLAASELALDGDGADPATRALVDLGAVKIVYVAPPGVDVDAAVRWCSARGVEATAVDAALKIHALAPLISSTLST
jgi:hypothetical protein